MLFKILLITFFSFFLFAKEISYAPFIDEQIKLNLMLEKDTIDEDKIDSIIEEKERLFTLKVEELLANKNKYLKMADPYGAKIYKLKKIIEINKRRRNNYAVLRDEVLLRSYEILQSQNEMIREILVAMDRKTFSEFSDYVNQLFVRNQKQISKINDVDFHKYLKLDDNSSIVKDLKNRIRENDAIIEINADVLKKIIDSQRKMYRLNKYYKYGLIKPVLYVNQTTFAKSIEPFLEKFNLSTEKLFLIIFVIFVIYIIKNLFLQFFKQFFENLEFKSQTVKTIIESITKPIELLTLIIGLNIIFYIYNDFSRIAFFSALFDIMYVCIIMWTLYKLINVIATVKISALAEKSNFLKHDLINISIKIVNFALVILTALLVLHYMGVNLTAILSGLGIGGFAVALAAKDSIANFFGTLSILVSNTFSQGDWIVVDKAEGVVVEIGLRVTTIRTFDNALISIPNSKLANEAIKNWNRREIGRRIKFRISVEYTSNKESLRKAINEIRELIANNEKIAKSSSKINIRNKFETAKIVSKNDALGIKNLQLVVLDELGESGIYILVNCFTIATAWLDWAKVKEEILFEVMEILEKYELEYAYPALALHHENELQITLDNQDTKAIPAKVQQS